MSLKEFIEKRVTLFFILSVMILIAQARHAIQLVLIEGVMMLIAFTSDAIDSSRPAVLLLIGGAVLLIYVLAVLFLWLGQVSESKKMTAQLHQLQQNAERNEID